MLNHFIENEKDASDLIENAIRKHNQTIANEKLKEYHKNDIKKASNILYNPERICKLSPNYDNNKQIKTWMKQAKQAEEMRQLKFVEKNAHTKFVLDYIFGVKND